MTILASGSRGNCTVVTGGRTSVLVDAGLSCREILKRMQQAGEDPGKLDAILITHEHQDHVQGLSVLARRLGIPVYFTAATHRAWVRWLTPQKRVSYAEWLEKRKADATAAAVANNSVPAPAEPNGLDQDAAAREAESAACAEEVAALDSTETQPSDAQEQDAACEPEADATPRKAARPAADPTALPALEFFEAGRKFAIGDLSVTAFTIPHDAVDPVGFVVEAEGIRMGMATDLGYMPQSVSQQLRGCDLVMLESNHDLDMLRDGPYPWSVKQRVLSRVGHLSNAAAAEFLERNYDGGAAYVVLAHLSESNNMPELARVAAEWALRDRMQLLANKLVVAAQHEPTESICF